MAAISAEDMDRNIVTFCYVVDEQRTVVGRIRTERRLPWAFVQFPDSTDPRYVAPVSGADTVGLTAPGGQPYVYGSEYMRNSPFPHEADRGNLTNSDTDNKAGAFAIHYFGGV